MIPDKIYIPIIEEDGKKLLCTNWWLTDARSRYVKETIPYIRKDALLEWAKKELSIRRDSGDSDFLPAIVVLDDLIEKLNSM